MGRQRKKKGRAISGWIVLDKPYDFGSTESVSKIKWLFKAQKAGHAGTLDPLASGMLPIALGEATKTVPYIMDGQKTYQFTVTWGEQRSTDDLEGDVIETSDNRPTDDAIRDILDQFVGDIMQIPPQFSAIKIDGARAYDIARGGEKVDIPEREVSIYELSLLSGTESTADFEVRCGKGTYIRALARDMGRKLGCFGYVSKLRRTAVAPFEEADMVPLDDLKALETVENDEERLEKLDAFLIGFGEALRDMDAIQLTEADAIRVRNGNSVLLRGATAPVEQEEICAFYGEKAIAIGSVAFGEFKPSRVFNH